MKNELTISNLELTPKAHKNIPINLYALDGLGTQGKVHIVSDNIKSDTGEVFSLNRNWTVGVRSPYTAIQKQVTVTIAPGANIQIVPQDFVAQVLGASLEAKLSVAQTPHLNISTYITSLFAYPYGCLEQTISGIFPAMLSSDEQLMRLWIKKFDNGEVQKAKVEKGIEHALSMQIDNGGFSLWDKYGSENNWLSVYATDFLLQAKTHGYQISEKVLKKAIDRISSYLYNENTFDSYLQQSYRSGMLENEKLAVKAYTTLVLARKNVNPTLVKNTLNDFYSQFKKTDYYEKNKNLPLPLTQLAVASHLSGDKPKADFFINLAKKANRNEFGQYLSDYGSVVRDDAQVVALLSEYQLYPEVANQYIAKLTQQDLAHRSYFSTQENNALFLAGLYLNENQAQNFKVSINNGASETHKKVLNTYYVGQDSRSIGIRNESNFPIYVNLNILGYPKERPQATQNEHLSIERQYYDIQGKKITPSQLNVGDLVLVELTVKSHSYYDDVLIVDFLPAGLELENQNLDNASVDISHLDPYVKAKSYQNQLVHQEFRDDRYVAAINFRSRQIHKQVYLVRAVVPGTYIVPPPYVELMYEPENFAIGDSLDKMTVKKK
ncbi:hypothetical protein GKC56_00400 [Neisseriaceae bacterium PsAf]|nr:hypothetical protein [Neisseriaceae bacterium PsAf]